MTESKKVSGVIDAMGFRMGQDQRRQILTLDKEFSALEAKVKALEKENLKLQAEVNPLTREVERLKKQVEEKKSSVHEELGPITKVFLRLLAEHPGWVTGNLRDVVHLPVPELEYHLDLLKERGEVRSKSV